MKNSNINWTHHTYNPWRGCSKISPGCKFCYAENLLVQRRGSLVWGDNGKRIRASAQILKEPHKWNAQAVGAGERQRVFVASLADVFDDHPTILPQWREDLWTVIRECPHLDWLLLTKRPENAMRFLPDSIPSNLWLGFSAENQECFDKRWGIVRELPVPIRFVSYEPAIGPLQLPEDCRDRLHWLIFGGETSARRYEARPASLDWARDVREDCARLGVAFWFKQTGSWIQGDWHGKSSMVHRRKHDRLDGQLIRELPVT